jgi:hypothetical protein
MLAFVALLAAAVAAPPPAACRPHLYDDVRTAVTARSVPRYATFETQLAFVTSIGETKRTFRSRAFPATADVFTQAITDEERADPPNPYGTNVNLFGMAVDSKKRRRERDHLGVPLLSPYYTFGLRRTSMPDVLATSAPAAVATIGRTATYDETYDVACEETPEALRLRLVPRRDAEKNRLRELLVDRITLLPQSAVVAGNFDDGLLRGTRWDVRFGACDGALCIDREWTDSPFTAPDGVRVARLDVAFFHVAAEPEPRLLFEIQRSWRSDRVLREPD